jgi:SAM-dependent methyltransferase
MAEHRVKRFRWQIAQFFERNWWRWYLGGKDKTQYLTWKKNYWRGFLAKIALEIPEHQTIADLGCGPAGIFTLLEQNQVVAIDPLIDQYQRDLHQFDPKDYPYTQFLTCKLEDWQPNQTFDTVFCINAINHVEQMAKASQIIRAATKAGGTIIISTDAHRYAFLQRLFSLVPGDILHPHQYTLDGYLAVFAEAGLNTPEVYLIKREGIFDYFALKYRV